MQRSFLDKHLDALPGFYCCLYAVFVEGGPCSWEGAVNATALIASLGGRLITPTLI